MKYELFEIITAIFELLNNPVGITSVIVSFLIGILICIYGNLKSRIICGCSLLVLAIFSIIVCIAQNSPDYLILPFFILPFFIITSIIFIFYDLIKLLKWIKHKNANRWFYIKHKSASLCYFCQVHTI